MRKHIIVILIIVIFLAGLSVFLYPAVSNFINSRNQSRVITRHNNALAEVENETFVSLLDAAHEWNKMLLAKPNRYTVTDEERARYREMLNATGNGIMGYIEIEVIGVRLPIYHGAEESTLQIGVGHIEWSSLPVGGENTHAVLTAHTGLPSAEMFNKLDRLKQGDTFTLRVLQQELTYMVDQILVVEPSDTGALVIIEGMDYCTLITCTPIRHQQPPYARSRRANRPCRRTRDRAV
jgi:sortase A